MSAEDKSSFGLFVFVCGISIAVLVHFVFAKCPCNRMVHVSCAFLRSFAIGDILSKGFRVAVHIVLPI